MSVSERIRLVMDRKKVSTKQLGEWLGVSDSRIRQKLSDGNWDSLKELEMISDMTGYALNWIVQGIGAEQESDALEELERAHVPLVTEGKAEYSTKRIPFYDVEATAGNNGGDVSAVSRPTGTIDIGDILRDSEAALRIAGNSMMPGYPPGCVVGLVAKRNRNITPGEVYVYEDEDGRYCKRLFYKDDDPTSDTLICYSDTTTRFESGPRKDKLFYPPYELKISAIVRLFSVTGVVKRNTNGVINYKTSN